MENEFQKPRRGRPRLLDPESEALFRQTLDSPVACLRTVQNRRYFGNALLLLCGDDNISITEAARARWPWLLTPDRWLHGECRMTVLSQLGRIQCRTTAQIFADRLCTLKPTPAAAVRMLRAWRERRDDRIAIAIVMDDKLSFTDEEIAAVARWACGIDTAPPT